MRSAAAISTPEADAARRIVARETALSVAINVAISTGFFLAFFGLSAPAVVPGVRGYALDFLPQAFMVTLMGCAVPGLIQAGKAGTHDRLRFFLCRGRIAIIVRSLALAVAALAIAGGGALALLRLLRVAAIAPVPALALKMLFGGLVALATTPSAIRFALCLPRRGNAPPAAAAADQGKLS